MILIGAPVRGFLEFLGDQAHLVWRTLRSGLALRAGQLAVVGVTRLSAIGQMAQPAPGWHNDGRPSLLDLVTLVDLEASAEALAERLTRYET